MKQKAGLQRFQHPVSRHLRRHELSREPVSDVIAKIGADRSGMNV